MRGRRNGKQGNGVPESLGWWYLLSVGWQVSRHDRKIGFKIIFMGFQGVILHPKIASKSYNGSTGESSFFWMCGAEISGFGDKAEKENVKNALGEHQRVTVLVLLWRDTMTMASLTRKAFNWEGSLTVLRFNPLSSWWGAWQHAGRHGTRGKAESCILQATGSKLRATASWV